MKILLTGAAGFIGSYVARALLEEGHTVIGIDNYNDYYDPALKHARISSLDSFPLFTIYACDICDLYKLRRYVREHEIEVVCHLAAQAGVRYSLENPYAYQKSNMEGFLSILELCRKEGIPRLVYASSSSVYAGCTKVPFSEDDRVDRPISLYAATKKANELMAHTYTHLYGFQTIGLRFFTVYGPWGRPDMAYWLFTKNLLAGKPIQVFNHGNMQRDFTYIDDIREGVLRCLFGAGLGDYEVFNLGNQHPEKLTDMIAVLSDCLKVKPEMHMMPMQPGDVETTYADITHAREKLGFEPSTTISEGLPRFVEWYREYFNV